MNSLNSILLEGNLVRDPDSKFTPKGTPVCSFALASNRFYRQGDETQKEVSYFEVETWAGLAERCAQELAKGRGVRVVGRLKQDRWEDTEGNTKSKIKIVAEHVEIKPIFSKDAQVLEPHPESEDQGPTEERAIGNEGDDHPGVTPGNTAPDSGVAQARRSTKAAREVEAVI